MDKIQRSSIVELYDDMNSNKQMSVLSLEMNMIYCLVFFSIRRLVIVIRMFETNLKVNKHSRYPFFL
jgi:hypothetical protein